MNVRNIIKQYGYHLAVIVLSLLFFSKFCSSLEDSSAHHFTMFSLLVQEEEEYLSTGEIRMRSKRAEYDGLLVPNI